MTETTLQETIRKFDDVKQEIRTSEEVWTAFLTCAARNHKYAFHDQLLIYKQRPEATACAEMDLWNKRFHRWVNKGQKSIKLLDDAAHLRHVFDVGDTHPARGARERHASLHLAGPSGGGPEHGRALGC